MKEQTLASCAACYSCAGKRKKLRRLYHVAGSMYSSQDAVSSWSPVSYHNVMMAVHCFWGLGRSGSVKNTLCDCPSRQCCLHHDLVLAIGVAAVHLKCQQFTPLRISNEGRIVRVRVRVGVGARVRMRVGVSISNENQP